MCSRGSAPRDCGANRCLEIWIEISYLRLEWQASCLGISFGDQIEYYCNATLGLVVCRDYKIEIVSYIIRIADAQDRNTYALRVKNRILVYPGVYCYEHLGLEECRKGRICNCACRISPYEDSCSCHLFNFFKWFPSCFSLAESENIFRFELC